MIICSCKTVRCEEIRNLVRKGVRDLSLIKQSCGAGTGCGGCHSSIAELVHQCSGQEPSVPSTQSSKK